MDVTLIVKASNQQCEDLTIKCEPSWTIRRLKGHLTEVYPGKPSTDEQKLIYSGQLLSDSVVLKDVLRQYDGQQAHTVHLVFTPKNSYYGGSSSSGGSKSNTNSKMVSNTSTSSSAGTNTSSSNSNGSTSCSNAASNASVGTSASTYDRRSARDGVSNMEETLVDGASGDGVRHRSVSQARSTARTNPPRASQFAEQTAAYQNFMQHTYMQYFNQYVNLINGQNNANALYSASGLPGPVGATETTPTTINPLSGSQPFPAVPFVPMVQPTTMAGGFPNLAYYPCMTPAPYPSGFPSPTNIPSAPSGTLNAGNVPAGVLSSSTLPSSSSGSTIAGDASTTPSVVASSATGTDTATTVATAAEQAGAPQDGVPAGPAAAAAAAAPAQARRFPNIVVEEQENNDWLDVFFSMCRVGILITVIYLYSSPMRCLTVLFIGVMLYLKKHLDRVYQAIDRRIPRLQPNQDANAAAAAPREQQPVPAVQPNNNVPDHNAAEQQRPHAADVGASGVENVSKTTRNGETENATGAGPSGSQGSSSSSNDASTTSSTVGRNADQPTANAVADEQQQLLQQTERTNTTEGETATAEQPAAEGQRMTFNDMTSFLGTLVITFFTSIIPDTPAA